MGESWRGKWMSFNPLIPSWTPDGQAYETVALKHSTYTLKIRGLDFWLTTKSLLCLLILPCVSQELKSFVLFSSTGLFPFFKRMLHHRDAYTSTRRGHVPHAAASSRSPHPSLWFGRGGNPSLSCVTNTSINSHSLTTRYHDSRHIRIHGRVAAL